MLTISFIEDDALYRELLNRFIRSFKQARLLSACATAEEALARIPHEKPDVVLVDIVLPGMNGIECVRRLRALAPVLSTRFIILTGHQDERLIFEAITAGAHGYLLKNHIKRANLLTAIQEVMMGGAPMTPVVAGKVLASFRIAPEPTVLLSNREQEVLQLLSQGLMYKEIGAKLSISVNTVRAHVESIYHKLHVHNRKEAVLYHPPPQPWFRDYPRN